MLGPKLKEEISYYNLGSIFKEILGCQNVEVMISKNEHNEYSHFKDLSWKILRLIILIRLAGIQGANMADTITFIEEKIGVLRSTVPKTD